jgi:hypothetical protein
MGLLIKLNNGDTSLKSLKFGNDRPGGGDSGQPFIQSPIGDQNQPSALDTDFLLRGGINAPKDAAKDISRLTQYFVTPQGVAFIAKQELLSRTGVKTEATKGVAYGGSAVNEGIYNPLLSTVAQAGAGFLGTHFNKQGLDPTGIFPDADIRTYQTAISEQSVENFKETNRLVKLTDLIATNTTDDKALNGVKGYKLNNPGNGIILSYSGGPGSVVGVGDTLIKYATDNGGVNPLKSGKEKSYLVGKPIDQIEPDKFQIPLGASNLFTSQSKQTFPTPPTLTSLGRTTYQYDSSNSVYSSGSLTARADINSYLTSSYEVITRNSGSIKYVSPINRILNASGAGTTVGVNGSGRQIIVDPKIFTTSGSTTFMATDPNGVPLDTYSSRNTLFNDNLNQTYAESPKDHEEGYLANLDKNSGYYYSPDGKLAYVLNQYPRGIAADFRKTSRSVRGFNDAPEGEYTIYDKITTSSDYIGKSAKIVDKIYYSDSNKRISSDITKGNDLINFRIAIVDPRNPNNQTALQFKAYIDDFSDSYGASWKEQSYMGRGEKFFKYDGFDRNLSLGFTIVADNSTQLKIMYDQLNTLAASLAPTYTSQGYMSGNLHRLTVGNYISGQWGVMTGLQYTVSEDSPWEIDEDNQLPYYIQVSGIKFNVIHNFRPESQFNKTHQYINQQVKTNPN